MMSQRAMILSSCCRGQLETGNLLVFVPLQPCRRSDKVSAKTGSCKPVFFLAAAVNKGLNFLQHSFSRFYRECVVKSIAQGCSAAFQHERERSSVKGFEVGRSNPQSRKLLHLAKRDGCLILTVTKLSPLLPLSIA